MKIAAIVIGRNEGARLLACLRSIPAEVHPVIYVDSGSTDRSVEAASELGATVVDLDLSQPFTAARARNAGLAALPEDVELVQFIDGDCQLRDGWISAASTFLSGAQEVAVVCGRRREQAPERSIYNRLIDREWDTPTGEAKACGGDALMRLAALRAVGGYRDSLIAGEEPELCVRLRAAGWKIWRLDAEMTWHDAALTRFGQWWRRSLRAGHAFAEGAALHGAPPERHWVRETQRALVWGLVLPLVILLAGVLATSWAFLLALIYPLQVLRLSRAEGVSWAFFTVLGKFPEALGALKYYLARWQGRTERIIEYKG